jgi:hypothetical protein
MNDMISFPSRAYHYVDTQYGTIGLIFAGLLVVFSFVGAMVWWDRRK